MFILLVPIYFIGDYWLLFYWWLLMTIFLVDINGYSITGYWWFFLLIIISNYSIGGY
jgi:hypothetical protein